MVGAQPGLFSSMLECPENNFYYLLSQSPYNLQIFIIDRLSKNREEEEEEENEQH